MASAVKDDKATIGELLSQLQAAECDDAVDIIPKGFHASFEWRIATGMSDSHFDRWIRKQLYFKRLERREYKTKTVSGMVRRVAFFGPPETNKKCTVKKK